MTGFGALSSIDDDEWEEDDMLNENDTDPVDLSRTLSTLNANISDIKDSVLTVLSQRDDRSDTDDSIATLMEQLKILDDRQRSVESKFDQSITRQQQRDIETNRKDQEVDKVVQVLDAAESVDLAFIIDCTASMTRLIQNVKTCATKIVNEVQRTNKRLKLRFAVVGYRDLECGVQRYEVLDFVASIETFETFVASLEAITMGDCDNPEDMAGGIQQANNLSWSQSTRVVFLIADYPCHGREFHDFDDNYPQGTPGIDIIVEIKKLLSNHGHCGTMSVYFGRLTEHCDKMINVFKSEGAELEVVKMDDTKKLSDIVTRGVRRSIFKTVSVTIDGIYTNYFSPFEGIVEASNDESVADSRHGHTIQNHFRVVPKAISLENWKAQLAVSVKVYRNRNLTSMMDLRVPMKIGVWKWKMSLPTMKEDNNRSKECSLYLRRSKHPFAEGQGRLAYHGQLAHKLEDLDMEKSAMVLKSFKNSRGVNCLKQYLNQMEVSNVASFLAKLYSQSFCLQLCTRIEILQVCVVVEAASSTEASSESYFCAETPIRFPEGCTDFVRYSNNTGYWDEDELHESLVRFSIWTYDVTGGYLMVTDLQGTRNGRCFVLTDPAILCEDILRFGSTNLGKGLLKRCIDATRALAIDKGWH